METCSSAPKFLYLFFCLLSSTLILYSTAGVSLSPVKDIKHQQVHKQEQTSLKFQLPKTVSHDFFNFPATDTSTPAIITIPSTTPAPITPTTPAPVTPTPSSATPVPVTPTPSSTPVTVSPTTPTTNPGVTNPVTTPVVAPPSTTTAPAVAGQSWCVAKTGVPEKSLQSALDYACGIGKADCSGIQQGASCYNPNTLQNHASVAFNNYYQKNPVPTSCDFGSTAIITTANPSSGSCIFTSSSSSSSPTTVSPTTTPPTSTPITTPPTNPTSTPITTPPSNPASTPIMTPPTPVTPVQVPTTSSSTGAAPIGSSGALPGLLNASYPGLGGDPTTPTGFGESPLGANMTSSVSRSRNLQRFIGSILVATSIFAGGIVFDI